MAKVHDSNRRTRWVIWVCAGTLIPFFLMIAAALFYRHELKVTDVDVRRQIARIHAAGEPVTLNDLAKWAPAIGADDDAAPVLEKAFEAIQTLAETDVPVILFGNADIPLGNERLSDDVLDASTQFLQQNESCLTFVDEALERTRCHFAIDYSKGVDAELPHLPKIMDLARLLVVDAIVSAERNSGDASCKALMDALQLGERLRYEPLLVSQFTRVKMHDLVILGLERVLNLSDLDATQLEKLQRAFAAAQDPELGYRAFIGDRCTHIAIFQKLIRSGGLVVRGSEEDSLHPMGFLPGRNTFDFDTYLKLMGEVVDASRLGFPQRLDRVQEIDAEIEHMDPVPWKSAFTILSSISLRTVNDSVNVPARDTAILSLCETAIAVERYQQASHKMPESLQELVPTYIATVPLDPFVGRPIRLVLDDGFTLYSVGYDRTDDGGEEPDDSDTLWEQGDYSFWVER